MNEVPTVSLENTITLEDLKQKISILSHTEDGEPLKDAMRDLKKALLENPQACALLLPEDIGECFKAIRRLTTKEISEVEAEAAPKKKKATTEKINMADAIKDLADDDFV